jgi:hypothetical protein
MTPMRPKIHRAAPLFAVLLAGCATAGPPATALVDAESALRRAEAADAMTLAPVQMRFAADKLSRAREASQARDFKTAAVLAAQAEVDAELAQAKAHEARAREAANAQQAENDRLRRDLLDGGTP